MQIFRKEFGHRYDTYEFGYSIRGKLEKSESPDVAYRGGFLPYSAEPALQDEFYMARSVRIPLTDFKLSSENRRIIKKFEGAFTTTVLSKDEITRNEILLPCLLTYFASRHGERVMSEERARSILSTPLPLRAVRHEKDGEHAGYVLEVVGKEFSHYWYSCYSDTYTSSSFGMWMMLDSVLRAQTEKREYAYLGTAYGFKGRYKTNFHPLEFWDGSVWSTDVKELKRLIGEA